MPTQNFETIEWSLNEDRGIGRIELDRPESMNAVSDRLGREVVEGFEAFTRRNEESDGIPVRAVVIEGRGDRAFSAGADITEMESGDLPFFSPTEIYVAPERFAGPVIASIDGYCLAGGMELALACDFRFASERSMFGLTEVDIGMIPGAGGTQRLTEIAGPSRAKELVMTGKHVSAAEALEDGVVDELLPAADLDDRVAEFAEELASKPPLAVQSAKDVIDMAAQVGLREGRMYEHRVARQLRETEDHREGVAAFNEKREPSWSGK